MIILIFVLLGLLVGSFINALVWRVYQQEQLRGRKKAPPENLSILKGRSICTHCKRRLAAKDLVPVVSWLILRGRCRYCQRSIGLHYPLVELVTAVLFGVSFAFWPGDWGVAGVVNFGVWLVVVTGLVALFVYDLKWMLLPNRIVYPLILIALALAVFNVLISGEMMLLYRTGLSLMVAAGIFYLLFQASGGKWIGGGDVKLGVLIGLLLQDPYKAFMVLLFASMLGTLFVIPAMATGRLTSKSRIPFGPFLICSAALVYLFGSYAIEWYKQLLLL